MKDKKTTKYTSIGGSALIEGVMMRSDSKMSIAVRKQRGDIVLKVEPIKKTKSIINKIPILRGVIGFIMSMITSYKSLMYSADVSMEDILEEEPESKFEKWLTKVLGKGFMNVLMVFSVIIGLAISVLAFIYLPTLLTDLFSKYVLELSPVVKRIIVGVLKMLVFLIYMLAVSRMKDMRRLFEYHGAEHKTFFCFEAKRELTPENAKSFKRFHPRCGTSFIIITLIVSIIVSMMIPWQNAQLHTLLKLLFLPVVMGIAYEFIKLAGKYDNLFTRIISAPGLWFQRITTSEPDSEQLSIAIWALRGVLEDYPLNTRLIIGADGVPVPQPQTETDAAGAQGSTDTQKNDGSSETQQTNGADNG